VSEADNELAAALGRALGKAEPGRDDEAKVLGMQGLGGELRKTQAQTPSIGRIVHYTLSEKDVEQIKRLRHDSTIVTTPPRSHMPKDVHGPFRVGNTPSAGDVLPLMIVRVWPDEGGPGIPGVNGQVMLDGNDVLWVTSVHEGEAPSQWQWPPRV